MNGGLAVNPPTINERRAAGTLLRFAIVEGRTFRRTSVPEPIGAGPNGNVSRFDLAAGS